MRRALLRLLVFAILMVCCRSSTQSPIGDNFEGNLEPSMGNIENGGENSLLLALIGSTRGTPTEKNLKGNQASLPGKIENGAENSAEKGVETNWLQRLFGRTTEKPYKENIDQKRALATGNIENGAKNGGETNWLQAVLGVLLLLFIFAFFIGGTIWTCYSLCASSQRLYTPCQEYTNARGATAPKVYKQLRKRWLVFEKERTHIVEKYQAQYPKRLHVDEVSWWLRQSQLFKELEDYTLECAQYFPTKEYSGGDVPSTTDLSVHFAAESEAIEIFASNVKNTLERLHHGRF